MKEEAAEYCAAPVLDGIGRIVGVVTLDEINRLIGALVDAGKPPSTRAEAPILQSAAPREVTHAG
jgi:hypothetical protein